MSLGRRVAFIVMAAVVGSLVYGATHSSGLSYVARSITRTLGY